MYYNDFNISLKLTHVIGCDIDVDQIRSAQCNLNLCGTSVELLVADIASELTYI